MAEQIDIFDNKNKEHKEGPDEDEERNDKDDTDSEGPDPRKNTYRITTTKKSLHDIGERLAGRFDWVLNSTLPYSGSNVIRVDYNLNYDDIAHLYQQDRILTYQVGSEYTTWINKSVRPHKKSRRRHRKQKNDRKE